MNLTTADLRQEIEDELRARRKLRSDEERAKIMDQVNREKSILTMLAGVLRADAPVWSVDNEHPDGSVGPIIPHPTLTIAGIKFTAMASGEVGVNLP